MDMMNNPLTPLVQLAYTFFLQFYHDFGKLEGLRIIGEKTIGAEEVISQERKIILVSIKNLWEAFGNTVRNELAREPEAFLEDCLGDDPDDNHPLKTLKEIKDEMAQVEVDPSRLAQWEKRYFVILNGKQRLKLV